RMFPAMVDSNSSFRDLVLKHGTQEVRSGCRVWIRREFANELFKFTGAGKKRPIFRDEAAQRSAIAFAANSAGEQREMNVAPGFIPGSKSASRDIFLHALGR